MEKVVFEKDIQAVGVAASSFPSGVMQAFENLHNALGTLEGRQTFGISHANAAGEIYYLAAATALQEGEAEQLGLTRFTIKKGPYSSVLVHDFQKDMSAIGQTFERLLADPKLDPQGYCLEIYLNERDVQCLVKLES